MAGFMGQEFLLNTQNLLQSLEGALTKNQILLTLVETLQSENEEEKSSEKFGVLVNLKEILSNAQGSNEKLTLELNAFQANLRKIVNTISECEKQKSYFEKENDRLNKRQEQLKLDRQRFEDEIAAFELELRKFQCKNGRDNSLLLNTSRKPKANLKLENFKRLLTAEKENSEKLYNTHFETKKELIDANKTIKILKQNIGDLLREMNEWKVHTNRMIDKLRENIFQVKKQQLAVTMEMKLAQEEADKYRTIFGSASEVAQNLEKVECNYSISHDNPGSANSVKHFSSAPLIKQSPLLLHRACTAPVSRAKANMMKKQGDIRKYNEALINENNRLRNDLQNMKHHQMMLQKKANEAISEIQLMKNQLSVCMTGKEKLHKQLCNARQQNQRLEKTLTHQANDLTTFQKQHKQFEEEIRWSKITPVSVLGAPSRYYSKPQQPTGSSRNIAVSKWSNR